MVDFLKHFDGTGRTPRGVQEKALKWIEETLPDTEVLVIKGPVGCGKSAIAKSVQLVTGCPIVNPSNLLIDQNVGDYPDTNFMKGKSHYHCDDGLSCEDATELLGNDPCPGCDYYTCKRAALRGEATFFNPMSLYYTSKHEDWQKPRFLIIDEAHQLASMILMMAGKRFRGDRYDFEDRHVGLEPLKGWLKEQRGKLHQLEQVHIKLNDMKRVAEIRKDRMTMTYTLQGLEEDPSNYAIWISEEKVHRRTEKFLNVKPVKPPQFITRQLLNAERVILMSGTLFDHDIEDLLPGRSFKVLDLESPIPKERRRIVFDPVPFKMNWKTPPQQIAQAISDTIEEYPGRNTIIHVSYAMSRNLAPFLPGALANVAEDKNKKLEEFKKKGGIFLAAGCAEGIDLKGDLCRLNIIPKLLYPNMRDPVVKKRMTLPDGELWYNLETIKTTIQQAGRSSRGEEDESICVIRDPGFLWRVKKCAKHLPRSFLEAIVVKSKQSA